MESFEYCVPTRLVFGRDAQKNIGPELALLARKVLLHYGGQSVIKSGLYDEVKASLRNAGIAFAELGGVVPNPRVSLVREGIRLCRAEGVDLILAVGGGSVIDSAKAIALGVEYEGDIWEVYENHVPLKKALPVAVVLTIPAAGSEASTSTVLSNEEKAMKLGWNGQAVRPVVSFINPELFMTLPKTQLAYGTADMMSHIFERYFTHTRKADLTDGLCESALKTIMRNALILNGDPGNYDAWCELGFAGTLAHMGLLGLGRTQDWACHAMEHELSALYDVAHGAGLAVLTPAWMRAVYRENLPLFVQFAQNVMGAGGSLQDPEAIALEGITRLEHFFARLGLPGTLSALGIGSGRLQEMAKKTTKLAYGMEERPVGGLKKLYWQDVLAIFESII